VGLDLAGGGQLSEGRLLGVGQVPVDLRLDGVAELGNERLRPGRPQDRGEEQKDDSGAHDLACSPTAPAAAADTDQDI
jgi:hypothetical protein